MSRQSVTNIEPGLCVIANSQPITHPGFLKSIARIVILLNRKGESHMSAYSFKNALNHIVVVVANYGLHLCWHRGQLTQSLEGAARN